MFGLCGCEYEFDEHREKMVIFIIKIYRLIDQALGKGVKVAVCSTSNEKAVCTTRFYNLLMQFVKHEKTLELIGMKFILL